MKQVEVIRTMKVSKSALYEWRCVYDSGGASALKAKKAKRYFQHPEVRHAA